MKIKTIVMSLFFAAALNADNLMVERFGITRVEPVYTGYVFVQGRYLDAPYIIEQRGVGLFINGHRFGNAIGPQSFPGPYDTPLYEDPGMPDDIDESTNLVKTYHHPFSRKKAQHWQTLEVSGDVYKQKIINYYTALPNILQVKASCSSGNYEIELLHRNGEIFTWQFRKRSRMSLPSFPTDEGRMVTAISTVKSSGSPTSCLSDRTMMVVLEDGSATWQYAPQAGLKAVISILDSDKSREEKIKDLIEIGFITDKTLSYLDYNGWLDGLLDDFQASDQLRQRLAGTWEKPEKPDLPTGLVQLPAFAKVETPQPDPPEGDFGEDMFGWMRSEPIVTGRVFVDGAYVDPPYVVEQRGNVLLINNRICENQPNEPLVFATFAPSVDERLPPGHWDAPPVIGTDPIKDPLADPFNEALDKADNRRIMLRMQALYYQVVKYLEEDGIVIAEDQRLLALHNLNWYNGWRSFRWRMIAYRWSPEYFVETLPRLFVPATDNERTPDDEEIETAIKRYGKFLSKYKVTPGFFIRLAGGDTWTNFLESHMPDQPSGIIRPPGIKKQTSF